VATTQQTNPDQIAAQRKFLILRTAETFAPRCGSAMADLDRHRRARAARAKYPGTRPGLPH